MRMKQPERKKSYKADPLQAEKTYQHLPSFHSKRLVIQDRRQRRLWVDESKTVRDKERRRGEREKKR